MQIDFTYHFMGANYGVIASFTPGLSTASMSGPYDDEATLDGIEVIGPDGFDCTGEFNSVFTREFSSIKMVSVLSQIEQAAHEELQVAA